MLDGPDEDGEGVLSERSPHEPEEFDPSSLGPDVPEPADGTPDDGVATLFWKLVVVFNIALLALSLGPMFAYFEGDISLGLQLTAAGVILFVYGYVRYRRFIDRRDGDTADHNG